MLVEEEDEVCVDEQLVHCNILEEFPRLHESVGGVIFPKLLIKLGYCN